MVSRTIHTIVRDWFLLGVCLLLCLAYFFGFVNRATVDLSIDVEKRTFFRVYWAEEGEEFSASANSRVLVNPGKHHYQFYLTNIGHIDRLRIDPHDYPGDSVIQQLTLSQKGWQPISLVGQKSGSALKPNNQVGEFSLDADGLLTRSIGKDPHYIWKPRFIAEPFGWPGELARLLILFGVIYLAGIMARNLVLEKRYVPLYLAAAVGLILVMAVISKQDVHPDEYVHIKAASYYVDNWLPPEVGSDEIRHTYSRYGVSRLNGFEIYYFFAGKFGTLIESLNIPDYMAFRLFNVLLFSTILLISLGYRNSRMMMAVLLVSPQLWYVFSYCNSDAFALFAATIAGWQVVDKNSLFNRYLSDRGGINRLLTPLILGLMAGLLMMIKKNYYPFALFLLIVVLYGIWLNRENSSFRTSLIKLFVICLIGISLPMVKLGLDYFVNGVDRNDKIAAMQEELAEPMFNPATELAKRHVYLSMKERGVTLAKMIHVHRWFEKSFRSGFGVYGYMTVSATHVLYDLMRWLIITLVCFVVVSVLVWGSWSDRLTMVAAIGVSAALIGASFHHSWTADFQAQGRYLFPIALLIGVAAAQAERAIGQRIFCVLLSLMFFISSYSFIVVGLQHIPMAAG